MDDIEIAQKEIENKLFDFIEENFGKKRYECFNEVVNFVKDKIIPTLSYYDEDVDGYMNDLEIENKELEDRVVELKNAFDALKAQIEKMKCCGNCKWNNSEGNLVHPPCKECNWDLNKWEIKEK